MVAEVRDEGVEWAVASEVMNNPNGNPFLTL
jgi:hypothetical protein